MKFTGLKPLVYKEKVIEIESTRNIFDLHNCGLLKEYKYVVKDKLFIISWHYFNEENTSLNLELKEKNCLVSLKFKHVTSLSIGVRDDEVPYFEDDCLSEIVLLNDNEVSIKFMNGQRFLINCLEVELLTTNIYKIFVRLLSEGVDVSRPVKALHLKNDIYKIIDKNYEIDEMYGEKWEFQQYTLVRCIKKDGLLFANESIL